MANNKHELACIEDVERHLGSHADGLNWLIVLSDTVEEGFTYARFVEVLIVQPRKTRTFYGEVRVDSIEEARWLAAQAAETLPHLIARGGQTWSMASTPVAYFERTPAAERV